MPPSSLVRRLSDVCAGAALGVLSAGAYVAGSGMVARGQPEPSAAHEGTGSLHEEGAATPLVQREQVPPPRAATAAASESLKASGDGEGSDGAGWRQFCRWGLPSNENVRVYTDYASSLNFRTRAPNWVAEHLTRAADGERVDRKHSRFRAEKGVPEMWRATNEDYRGSQFSRGHMAPAGAHKRTQAGLDETFLLSSNIVPQEMSNNGSDWLRLERLAKELLRRYTDVYVVSGPLYLPGDATEDGRKYVTYEVIGKHAVAAPTHLFKVICAHDTHSGEQQLSAFLLPNGPVRGHPPLDTFVVPLAELERLSGLALFREMPGRERARPLCAGKRADERCGVGHIDGRIEGWKVLGHLKLSQDCAELSAVWSDAVARSGRFDAMPVLSRAMEHKASSLACEWKPPTPAK
eukprot:CAMPEP_0119371448 /NCGR_PEP_ID=MMETSP1334-20130426/17605_1 /TAXON_ID=127549 /ORGANISM="Calcidiscus leptoporus, Strain RCC1130" /LENGTH=406 /DNA_ID=CAMNT_0007388715 /DNA_START=107 /DNA_END=1327 /DNA_ORIENTATION=+